VETKTGKIRIVKAERRRGKRESRKEARGKGKEEKTIDVKKVAEE